MAYIDFKKLKARVSIREVFDHYELLASLEETSQGYEGACPFCGSNAFKVNTTKNVWYCFGECKTTATDDERYGGNMLDFVAKKEGVSVKKAAGMVAGWFPAAAEPQSKNTEETKSDAKAKEPEPSEQSEKTKEITCEEPTPAIQEGEEDATQEPPKLSTVPETEPDLTGCTNTPLEFTLKSIDVEHPVLETLGLTQETLQAFGVGYFTGKGSMAGKIVLPFHDADGLLVAYAGVSPERGTVRYPKQFDRRLELYNTFRAGDAGSVGEGIVLVTDLLHVMRLYELGVHRVVALPSDKMYAPQLTHLTRLVGEGGQVDFMPNTETHGDTLAALLPHFHVRLHRFDESDDNYLSQVADSLG